MVNIEIRLIIFFAARWKSSLQSAKTRLGADSDSDYELLIAKSRLKLKKTTSVCFLSGKSTRPFRYDLNQIPYYYTVEVTNSFKGLDQIATVPKELQTEFLNMVQKAGTKTIPKEKKCKKVKWLSEKVLQIAKERR